MNADMNRIDHALNLVTETAPGLTKHADLIKAELAKLMEDYGEALADPVQHSSFMTLAVGEITLDLSYCLEQATEHMDTGKS